MDLSRWENQLNQWRNLSANEKLIFADAWLSLVSLSLLLRWAGFRRTQAILTRFTPGYGIAPHLTPQSVAQQVERASRVVPLHVSCLARSLTLWWLLLRSHIASDLCIGVRKNGALLEAHAWIEWQGTVLNDVVEVGEHYAAFDSAAINQSLEWR